MNHNSLCARVMKGRYFQDSNFMQATVPKSSMATWRVNVARQGAIQIGLVKRFGDGSSILVWEDMWIPYCFNDNYASANNNDNANSQMI